MLDGRLIPLVLGQGGARLAVALTAHLCSQVDIMIIMMMIIIIVVVVVIGAARGGAHRAPVLTGTSEQAVLVSKKYQ